MQNTVPSGPGLNVRVGGPSAPTRPAGFGSGNDLLFHSLAADALEDYSTRMHDLVRQAMQPIAPTLTRTLRDLAYSYVPAQGLGGTLHFDDALPELDVAEGPLRAILEHLVESALRANPSIKPYCHVGLLEDAEDKVVLSLRDNGTPLPECTMEDLRAFLRTTAPRHVPDRVHRLLLADNLVQWLGGKVSIAPTPGADGTTVLLELPRTRGPPQRDPLVGRHVF